MKWEALPRPARYVLGAGLLVLALFIQDVIRFGVWLLVGTQF